MTKGTEIRYRVRGGTPLQGTVFIQGAKNAALKMIAASLLPSRSRVRSTRGPMLSWTARSCDAKP